MDIPEKLTKQGTQDEEDKAKTQHNMCWIPLYANKHKQREQNMNPPKS